MALTRMCAAAVAALLLLAPAAARAQTPDAGPPPPDAGPPPADAGPPGDAQPEFEPPRALTDTTVPYPDGAPPQTEKVVVTVKLLVDATGAVQKVDLLTPPQPVFDEAVVKAAQGFKFDPARYGGKPVPVEITFSQTFQPPKVETAPEPAVDQGAPLDAVLRGRLLTLGTRAPVTAATVSAAVGDRHYSADSDDRGRFRLPLPAGTAHVTVNAPGYNAFLQVETLAADQELAVTYYVERERYDPYEIVVVGNERREEVSSVKLRGAEIKQVPGTFGDPFRVIQALPGVAAVVSLLPFPVVRGASPASTGFLLDGTRVPLLYHLLYGPSVIHPDFIDEVQFFPGGAPVLYGGYTGGIVDGHTERARGDAHLLDFDANLLQMGGLVRQPIKAIGATATVAARYGYPGLVLSLATNEASLSYWDYQVRLDGGNPRNGWTVFAFGANDELDTVAANADPNDPTPPLEPALILGFHRLDLRLHHGAGKLDGVYRLVLGYDHTVSAGSDVPTWIAESTLRWRYQPADSLTLVAGLEGSLHDISLGISTNVGDGPSVRDLTAGLDRFTLGSALIEALWRPTTRLLVRPGVRGDLWYDGTTRQGAIDPRLTVRYKLAHRDLADVPPESDDSAVWLKGSLGIYHQPPRFVIPLPGLDQMPLRYGLLRSYQASLGAEIPLEGRLSVSVEGFASYMDPTIFDLSVNAADLGTAANTGLFPTMTSAQGEGQDFLDRLTTPQTGRSYGLELMARRASKSGLHGWIAYTLSRAERQREGGAWAPYDFDRTHLINLVAGLPLDRNWDVGLRAQYQSGHPTTTTAGYNTARVAGYLRFDLRVDKHAVWRSWLLDFYVDVMNVALLPEEVTPGATLRYVLPTVGVRGRF